MDKITEIIPDNLPDWAREAFDEGQFFNVANQAMQALDEIEKAVWRAHQIDYETKAEILRLIGRIKNPPSLIN